jgi:hypothetical protein
LYALLFIAFVHLIYILSGCGPTDLKGGLMRMKEKTELKEKLTLSIGTGLFFELLHDVYIEEIKSSEKNLSLVLSELHNESIIDLNDEFYKLNVEDPSHESYSLIEVYAEALPRLNAGIEEVANCVLHLNKIAEYGSYRYSLFSFFKDFCSTEINRSKNAVEVILNSNDTFTPLLCSALIAVSSHDLNWVLSQCKTLINNKNIEVSHQIYNALGLIKLDSDNQFDIACTLLEDAVRERQAASAMATIFNSIMALGQDNNRLWGRITILINQLLEDLEPLVLFEASRTAMWSLSKIPQDILNLLVHYLRNTSVDNISILKNIDLLLVRLSETRQATLADSLLEHLLLNNENLEITTFDSFSYYLLEKNKDDLNRILTKWFLSSEPKLCKAILDLVSGSGQENLELSFELNQLTSNEFHPIFVAKKAVGWLFTFPITAASLVLSVYKKLSFQQKREAEDLLFEPLLLSYPGKLKRYLDDNKYKEISEIKTVIEKLFLMLNQYDENSRKSNGVSELQAPEENINKYWREFNKKFELARDNGRKSVFEDFFSTQHLLYGNSTAHYVYDADGTPRRSELQMSSHSYSSELPALDVIDPWGLDYNLRSFRSEEFINEVNS